MSGLQEGRVLAWSWPNVAGCGLRSFGPEAVRAVMELAACKQPLNVPVQRRRGSTARCNRLLGFIAPLPPEYNMGGFLRRNELNAFVSQSAHVSPLK